MSQAAQIKRYLQYRIRSTNQHGVHSPFVFQLLTEVLKQDTTPPTATAIEALRQQLLKDERLLNITDYGAGSSVNKSKRRKVKDIAKHSAHPQKDLLALYRLIEHFQPKTLLELGTSLGLSAAYQASAAPQSKLFTLEGCPETAAIAQENLKHVQLENVECVVGKFEDTLPEVLHKIDQLDYVFFDGNHQEAPTLNYFEQCLGKAHNDSLFVFDDIHWSAGMEAAWEQIKDHEKVQVSIDLFTFGLVFFRKEQTKQHFILRY